MIRCILWRLLFEASNVARLFGHGSQQVQYLAFGANLSDAVLRDRKILPLATKHFTLRDYGLRFDHPSRWVGCGYASAANAPGEALHGVLYTLSGRDAARMDFYEIVPVLKRYRRTFVEQDGERFFFYQSNLPTANLSPTDEYLGFITEGLKSHPDVTAAYLDAVATTKTIEPGPMVISYPSQKNPPASNWLGHVDRLYRRAVQAFFLGFLYQFSLTAYFIRR